MDLLLGRSLIRKINLAGTEFYVRSNTDDVKVAITCLFNEEHCDVRCENPDVIIDAGANIGSSAVYFARRFPNARIIAIEMEKGNYDMLVMNTRGRPNIIPIHAALWSEHTKRMINDRHTGHLGYTISETSNVMDSTGQEVECVTISELIQKYDLRRINLLKMDIEGAEKAVLEHSADWMDKVDAITAELHDRISPGCDRAYYIATRNFKSTVKYGEKIIAYKY
jgi:FkbM family methyltransferase